LHVDSACPELRFTVELLTPGVTKLLAGRFLDANDLTAKDAKEITVSSGTPAEAR
jgi:hypothetical protein